MLARVKSAAHIGLESVPVEVEVDVANRGFPAFKIVGLPSKAVEEARERVRTAIVNSSFNFPNKKITVNLAPADLAKEGSAYDLPIALGILLASDQLKAKSGFDRIICYGELSLDGRVRHTAGVLLTGMLAKSEGIEQVFVSNESAKQAAVVEGIQVYSVEKLLDLINHLREIELLKPLKTISVQKLMKRPSLEFDLREVIGQDQAKRVIEVAAAGGHNVLMVGPPGSGKTMLARSMPGILPKMSREEALEVTRIYSATGMIAPKQAVIEKRPFRTVHHSTSMVGLIGGGSNPKPGEVSLAHLGVLFLDELAEFDRKSMEALRGPLQDGRVVISRAAARVEYPADFMLVAATNPCPCGYMNHPRKECSCSSRRIKQYRRKISGPILDRIDLFVRVGVIDADKFSTQNSGAISSSEVRGRVSKVRDLQRERLKDDKIFVNAQMRNKQIKREVKLGGEEERLMKLAVEKYDLSGRGYFKILKVARTIADLVGAEEVESEHLAEALQYRVRKW